MNTDAPAPKVLLADKGYDTNLIREVMEKRGGVAIITTKRNQLPSIDALRNIVDCCFNKLKNAQRRTTCYEETANSYLCFIHLVSTRLQMCQFVDAP